jgi:L-alanine-DL-glutamate epimerase-like enolase superfamily enzyme
MSAGKEHITDLQVSAYKVPTDYPESDGTLEWSSTTLVLVEVTAAGKTGIGYTYADQALAPFIARKLAPFVVGQDALNIPFVFKSLSAAIRNEGNRGMAYMALSAVDNALWDLKAKMLELPLCRLIGMVRTEAQVYGSGGFTSYPDDRLAEQLGSWADQGFTHVKMKVGREPGKDAARVKTARSAIGRETRLYVDANGAYTVRQALAMADVFRGFGVDWFEEPVSSDDLRGLKFIREQGPQDMMIAAGEYGYTQDYFANMIQSGAVDVLQADATRCGGVTGLLKTGHLCEAFHHPFSFHCAPALHLHVSICLNAFAIGEYFYDHSRIEEMLFDGAPKPVNGSLRPDLSRPGLGLEFKRQDAASYKVA